MRLRATHRQVAGSRYLQPGGPWDMPTLDQLAADHRVDHGAAVVDSVSRLDADALSDSVAALAGGLRAAGVATGDAVAWQLPNCSEALLLYRACWRIGAIAVPLHHQIGPSELSRMVDVVEPKVVFSRAGLPLHDRPGVLTALGGDDGWETMRAVKPVHRGSARGSQLAVALFTSGSTGEPKAVLHTHRALSYKAMNMASAHGLVPSDVVLMPAPLSHISGLLSGVLIPAAVGMRTVLMDRWDADRAIDLVRDEGVTFMIGPPTFFSGMAGAPGFTGRAVRSLRVISCGSMTISPEFVEATARAFGATVKRTYGSTEAPTITTSTWSDPAARARDTDGRAVGDAELRVVDPLTGRVLSAGCTGELELRGPELFAGYADPDQTRASMHRGWFRTGDLAVLDEQGWLTIVGRIKELIIRGGENIVPAEVERVLEAHPSIRQAVVVGYPDEHLGQRVAACVIATEPFDLDTCRSWFAKQGVARFKTPERVTQVAAYPLLSLGKPDRDAIRGQLAAGAIQ
ncbi:MAG: cyclohexanecarboxylate-CoA ligase [Acidimicrobiaceae bacterium]|nr:cyclohexanecarboxylate-CoA ligase [Acidimicrobiaceae bacterium]